MTIMTIMTIFIIMTIMTILDQPLESLLHKNKIFQSGHADDLYEGDGDGDGDGGDSYDGHDIYDNDGDEASYQEDSLFLYSSSLSLLLSCA